jgi:transglutaminase-like putative cysteine protease
MKNHKKTVKIEYTITFELLHNKSNVRLWLVQPTNSYCQEIKNISVSPQPAVLYSDKQGNKIGYFTFNNLTHVRVIFAMKLILWELRVNIRDIKIGRLKHQNIFRRYTKNEMFLERTNTIKKIARLIIKDNERDIDKIRAAFDYTVKNFDYQYPVKKRGVKNLKNNNLRGDCAEYSGFFVTLCRAMQIPARNVTGYVLHPARKKLMEHGCVQVYTASHGWLDFDTQYASLEKNYNIGIKKYFATRSDYRLIFANGFNIPLKPKIPKKYSLKYWNDKGLPLTDTSVQTLQPLIYVSDRGVRFKGKFFIK